MKSSWKKTLLGAGIVGVMVGGFAQPATAAYSSYYNSPTNKLVQHNSAASSGMAGGRAKSSITTADFYIHTLTFSGVGAGYTEYGKAAGTSPGYVYHYNSPTVAGSAQTGCFWSIAESQIQGQLTLTCQVNK